MKIGIKRVIFSVINACNFACKFCFPGHKLCGKKLTYADRVKIVGKLVEAGCEEITFIGGEPMLYPDLKRLIKAAKAYGLTTKIVTNGSLLTEDFLAEMAGHLDFITISVDSVTAETLKALGRQSRNAFIDGEFYYNIAGLIRKYGYALKINTVVTSINAHENLTDFINFAKPLKWKIFQNVSVNGKSDEFAVSGREFASFCRLHKKSVNPDIFVSVAPSEFIKGSCTMIDHNGRFFDIAEGYYNYSSPILEVGVERAFAQVTVHEGKFLHKMKQAG